MKTLVIGDIHGCFIEFQELLSKSGIAESDEIIALGDIVDRGPETPQVLDFFGKQPNARSLIGNHERKHIRAARSEVKLALSQVITREQTSETYAEAVRFMEAFPTWIELPSIILVHGYLEPGISVEKQLVEVLCGTIGGERYLQSRYDRPWFELYKGAKPVIVGHYDYLKNGQAFIYQNLVFGLDTSCVHGKALTGMILPDFTIVSVPSRGDHWSAARLQYRQQIATAKPKAALTVANAWDEGSMALLQEIIDLVARENERVLALLREKTDFESLPPRQQAKAYAAEIGETPLETLLHLARRGDLGFEKARKVLKNSTQVVIIANQVGLR